MNNIQKNVAALNCNLILSIPWTPFDNVYGMTLSHLVGRELRVHVNIQPNLTIAADV